MISAYQLVFLVCLFTGCATNDDPNHFTASKWYGGNIELEAQKIDADNFIIVARGAESCSEEEVMKAWVYMANKLAGGRRYEKDTKTSGYTYGSAYDPYGRRAKALMITGKLHLQ
ncbi:MAG TPA: hypothetical protein VMI53_00605 [Opitutaceae bacterium]|nr:hypothetical protein [Opitutaceae bacterium]